MKKPDYFAEFRPLFHQIVARQKADANQKFLHIHFPAPVDEVAQLAKFAKLIIERGPHEEDGTVNALTIHFLMFVVKMFDGIVDKSVQPLLLDFTAIEEERYAALMVLTDGIELIVSESEISGDMADALILLHSFATRLQAGNR